MSIHYDAFFVDRDLTIIYFTDSDTPNIFIVVDRTDQYL